MLGHGEDRSGPAGTANVGDPAMMSVMPAQYGRPPFEPLAAAPTQSPMALPPAQLDPGYSSALDALGMNNGYGAEPTGPRVKRLWAEGEFLIMWIKDGPNMGAQIVIGTDARSRPASAAISQNFGSSACTSA